MIHLPSSHRPLRHGRLRAAIVAGLVAAASAWGLAGARPSTAEGLPEWPTGGNIRVLEAEPLEPEAAEAIYQGLLDKLVQGYLNAKLDDLDYRAWQRLNRHPHLSDAHGMRYVNAYANPAAAGFTAVTRETPMPAGAIVALDSFSVIHSGATSRGPLFLMEKMPAGFWPEAGDWRYTLIMPNGRLYGSSKGQGNAAMQFCADCHEQAAERDYLFALPEPAGSDATR